MAAMSASVMPTLRPRATSASWPSDALCRTPVSQDIADFGLGAAAVLGGAHAQRAMHLIGHIPDGDRGHDVRLPGCLGLSALFREMLAFPQWGGLDPHEIDVIAIIDYNGRAPEATPSEWAARRRPPVRGPGVEGALRIPALRHGHQRRPRPRERGPAAPSVPNVRARSTWLKLAALRSLGGADDLKIRHANRAVIHPGSTDVRARYQCDFRADAARAAPRGVHLGRSAAARLALHHQRHPGSKFVRHRHHAGAPPPRRTPRCRGDDVR